MNLKTRIATVAAASIFALSMGTAALAQAAPPTTVSQEIVPNAADGTLSASLKGGAMSDIKFSNTAATSTGSLTLGVTDARGSNAGWAVTLQVGDFGRASDGQNVTGLRITDIASSGFAITDAGTLESAPGPLANITPARTSSGLNTEQTVLSAAVGAGTGVYTQPYNVSLGIPAQQAPGTYTAVVTVGIASGPGTTTTGSGS